MEWMSIGALTSGVIFKFLSTNWTFANNLFTILMHVNYIIPIEVEIIQLTMKHQTLCGPGDSTGDKALV